MWWLEEHNKTFFWSCVTLQIQAARKSRGKVVWKKEKSGSQSSPFLSSSNKNPCCFGKLTKSYQVKVE